MSNQSILVRKIKSLSETSLDGSLSSKLQTVQLFMLDNKKSPQLTAEANGKNMVPNLLRNYFSESSQIFFFLNPKAPQNYLNSKEFQTQTQTIFTKFVKTHPQYSPKTEEVKPTQQRNQTKLKEPNQTNQKNLTAQQPNPSKNTSVQAAKKQQKNPQIISEKPKLYPQIQLMNFLEFWLQIDSAVHIFYEKQFDALNKSVQTFSNNLYTAVSKHVSQIPSGKKIQPQQKVQQNNINKANEKAKGSDQSKLIEKKQESKSQFMQKEKYTEKKPNLKESDEEETPKKQNNSLKSIKSTKRQSQAGKNGIQLLSQIHKSSKNVQSLQKESNYSQNYGEDPPSQQISQSRQNSRQSTHSQVIADKAKSKDSFDYFLRKFYYHYCKKYINTIKDQQFEKLSDFYNSMNLTKFMVYVKDVKILKLQKSLTAKFLQQQFKAYENQKHCLEYESFAKIVMLSLQTVFKDKDLIETKGFEYIGVFNRENFASVMGRLGVIVPSKQILFSKIQDAKQLTRMVKSITKEGMINLGVLKILKENHELGAQQSHGHGYESNWDSNKLHPDLFLNEKQRKQQRLLQGLTIPKLNKLQPSKHMDQKLHEMVDQDYDPYLKRYNERNNKSAYESGNGHGMMKRIDERINNVVKRIR